ncbi:MAG: carotenoid biosynthesis protein [Deltaproteobacteria bacterium]|nr:carotenoid biosynthesis protein [Deltaproteobacteria bacterium]
MSGLEAAALAIVASFVVGRAKLGDARGFLGRLALLVVASFLAEDSSIRLYGFYFYDARWSLFVDQVPLAILLIWPVVIHSAWDLARHLLGRGDRRVALVGTLLVLADASLIEPVAVAAGLWRWTEPGLFTVPPLGILGWSFHAGLCMVALERAAGETSREALVLATPLGTHALLLAGWWGVFRRVNGVIPAWPSVGLLWLVSAALLVVSLRCGARKRVPLGEFLLRVPAALFFFVLLAIHGRSDPALVAWTLAFAPPYCSLLDVRLGGLGAPRS